MNKELLFNNIYNFNIYRYKIDYKLKINYRFLLYCLIGILSFFIVSQVLATPSDDYALGGFKPEQSDDALIMLGKIAGDVGGMGFFSDETAKDNPAVYMFKIFNTGVVALAAVMFMWNILSATINGAHDGQFLGKRYNSYWMPTRTTLGLVLIMPLMGNGWSPAQALMGWAAWAGTGIATAIAKSPQANINQNIAASVAGITPPMAPDPDDISTSIYQNFSCIISKSIEKATEAAYDQSDQRPTMNENWGFSKTYSTEKAEIVFGNAGGNESGCGYYSYEYNKGSSIAANDNGAGQAVATLGVKYREAVNAAIDKIVTKAANDANRIYGQLNTNDPVAVQRASDEWAKSRQEAINEFSQTYRDTMGDAVKQARQQVAAALKIDLDQSWIRTGLVGISALTINFESATATAGQESIQSPIEKTTVVLPPSKAEMEQAKEQGGFFNNLWNTISDSVLNTFNTVTDGLSSFYTETETAFQNAKKIIKFPFTFPDSVHQLLQDSVQDGNGAPISTMSSFGMAIIKLIVTFLSLLIAFFTIVIFISMFLFFAPVSAGGSLITGVMSLFIIICTFLLPMLFFGFKLVAILPFTPILMWIGALATYLVIFIESLFGAQLWAMAHLDTDGEGLGQRTTHGYLFLFNLVFRPSIMIISFYLATNLLGVMGDYANEIILGIIKTFADSDANYLLRSFMVLGAVFIWVSLMENLIHTCFSLINTVPQQVFTWIGGHFGSQIGAGIGEQVGQKAGQGFNGTTQGQIRSAIDSTSQLAIGGLREKFRELKPNKPKPETPEPDAPPK